MTNVARCWSIEHVAGQLRSGFAKCGKGFEHSKFSITLRETWLISDTGNNGVQVQQHFDSQAVAAWDINVDILYRNTGYEHHEAS